MLSGCSSESVFWCMKTRRRARAGLCLCEAQKRRRELELLPLHKKEEEQTAEEKSALELLNQTHKRRVDAISDALRQQARRYRQVDVTLEAYQQSELDLVFWPSGKPPHTAQARSVELERTWATATAPWKLGRAPGFVAEVLLAPGCVFLTSKADDPPLCFARWDFCSASPQEAVAGRAMGLLMSSEHVDGTEPSLVVVTAANASLKFLDFHSLRKLDDCDWPLNDSVISVTFCDDHLATLEQRSGFDPKVCLFICAPQFMPGSVWFIPHFDMLEAPQGVKCTVVVSPCCNYLACVGVYEDLNEPSVAFFVLSKGALRFRARIDLPVGLVGLFFRPEHLVAVAASGKVTYMTFQLETVFEFSFELPGPVTSCSVRDELWAVLSEGELFLCQDQFYVKSHD